MNRRPAKKLKAPLMQKTSLAAFCFILLGMGFSGSVAHAFSLQDQVDNALTTHVSSLEKASNGKRLQGTWQKLDTRLTLPVCPQNLGVEPLADRTTGRTTVKISCASPNWSLLVPVLIRAFQSVVVTTGPIGRNETINPATLKVEEREIKPTLNGFFTDPSQIHGRLAKRPIPTDQILTASMLKSPDIIIKGQSVIIEAASNSFAIRSAGTALTNGGLGDTIRVRNAQSGRVVEGVVVSEGKIRVAL